MNRSTSRITFFHPYFRDGGVERGMVILAREFRKRGIDAEVLTFGHTDHFGNSVQQDLRIVPVRASRAATSVVPLALHLRRHRPQWLVSAQSYANVVAVAANLLAGRPSRVLVTERLAVSRERKAYSSLLGKGRLKDRLILKMMGLFYRRADAMAANSADGARDLERTLGLPSESVSVLYNPTFDPAIRQKADEEVRHRFIGPGMPPLILVVGRLSRQKDYPTLIRAFAKVRSRRECRLLILGEGEERDALQELLEELGVADAAEIRGFANNPYKYMKAADVFVLSSLYEGLPNVLIEAVACGAPAVATNCLSGPREILLDGKGGHLVPVGDVDALAEAIAEVLDEPVSARRQGDVARAQLWRFESAHSAKEYLECMGMVRPGVSG